MKELSCDHFKAVFDPVDFVQCGQDTQCAYEQLKDYIAYVHIKDVKISDGSVVPAGRGDGRYQGAYYFQCDPFERLDPHDCGCKEFSGRQILSTVAGKDQWTHRCEKNIAGGCRYKRDLLSNKRSRLRNTPLFCSVLQA